MASLRLALKASMEDAHVAETKKPAPVDALKGPKPPQEKVREKDGKTHREAHLAPRREGKAPRTDLTSVPSKGGKPAGSTLTELSAYKMHRKNSRLSDTQSVASEDSAQSHVSPPQKKQSSGDEVTPVKTGSASKKRNFEAMKLPETIEEGDQSPVSKVTPVKAMPSKKEKKTFETVKDADTKLQIDLGAVKKVGETDKTTAAKVRPSKAIDVSSEVEVEVPEKTHKDVTPAESANIPPKEDSTTAAATERTNFQAETEIAPVPVAAPPPVAEEGSPKHATPLRRRTSSDAEPARGSGASEDDTAQGAAEDMTPRNKRAAAVMAKTKLNTRKHLDQGELEKDLLAVGIAVPEDEVADVAADDASRRSVNKSAKKAANQNKRALKKETAVQAISEEEKFACCDVCEKWRKLPQHVNTSELPEKWVCSMNIWDSERNNCDAPEEVFPDPSRSPIPFPDEPLESFDDGKGRSKNRGSGSKKRRLDRSDSMGGEDEDGDVDGKRKGNKRLSNDGKKLDSAGQPSSPEQWVLCEKCAKWRKVATGVDPADLPKVWYCSMNTWNPLYSRCSARQEKSQDKNGGPAVDEFAPPTGRGKYTRKPNAEKPEGIQSAPQTPVSVPVPGVPGLPVKKVTQWVQCERKNCQKWRKVAAHIDMEAMPEKWYCEMNNWDHDRATCDAPEEDASDTEGAGASGISTQLIVGNSKGANALSYRRLIFSQDGRLRPVYSEKNKYGHGLFSYSEVHTVPDSDEYIPPTRCVGYWWSSIYDDAMGNDYSTGSKRHPTVSVPGAKKDKDKDSNPKNLGAAYDLSQHAFDIEDEATVVSKREVWPMLIDQQTVPVPDPEELVGGSFHLVDAYRRMHRMRCPLDAPVANPMQAKHISRRSRMSIQDILRAESSVVRSCVSIAVRDNEAVCQGLSQPLPVTATDGFGSVTLASLWSMIQSARFLTSNEECCRACMTVSSLKNALHRLEDADEVRVTFSSTGELCAHPLQSLRELIMSRKMKHAVKDLMISEVNQKLACMSSPLAKKIEKLPASSGSSIAVDPLYGTPYYWAASGEKERIVVNKVEPIAPTELSVEPRGASVEGAEGSEALEVCSDSVDATAVSSPTMIPVVPPPQLQKQSIVFGSVRPPLKLRKLLKSYYCITKVEK